MDSEYILSSHRVAERPGGLDFFDLTELHAWAAARSLDSLSEALPPAESGKRIQMAMIPSYIGEHVRKVVGDDMAEASIKAQPDRFASYSEEAREAAPLWVYSSVLTGELEAQLLAAVKAGELKLYDESGTPRAGTDPNAPTEQAADQPDYDAELAALFDPVQPATLEALFPDGGKWGKYAERAARNGLIDARVGRGKFNPYKAGRWWMDTQAPPGWKWERCARVLANNLPSRSRDCGHLLTGDFD